MPYKLNVVFSGVLGFVVHKEKRGACVLLADGRVGAPTTAGRVDHPNREDDQESTVDAPNRLDRHFGFLRIPGQHLGYGPSSELVRYLDRERVRFRVVNPRSSNKPWDFTDILALSDIVPKAGVTPSVLKATPPKSVLAQVILEGGDFRTTGTGGSWKVKNALTSNAPTGSVAYEATWSVTVPTGEPTIALEPLDGGRTKTIPLKPANREVTVYVSNVCHENPLRWTHYDEVLRDDVDFRWHYELLTPSGKKAISDKLPTKGLAPHPAPGGGKLLIGGGMNCVFTLYEDAAYTL